VHCADFRIPAAGPRISLASSGQFVSEARLTLAAETYAKAPKTPLTTPLSEMETLVDAQSILSGSRTDASLPPGRAYLSGRSMRSLGSAHSRKTETDLRDHKKLHLHLVSPTPRRTPSTRQGRGRGRSPKSLPSASASSRLAETRHYSGFSRSIQAGERQAVKDHPVSKAGLDQG